MKNFSIQKPISFSGVGLHSGVNTNITLKPSEENSGIFFNRTDLGKIIPARWDHVVSTKFSTNLGLNDIEVKTVEHLLSALAGLHINNCEILIDNLEVPILDGSSKIFVDEILKSGLKEQTNYQNILEIKRPVKFECDYGFAELLPNESVNEGLNIYLQSSFDGKYEDQDISIQNLNGNYIESISKARTFGFFHEIEYLKSQNLIKGGSLDNAIVIKDRKPLNKDGLRYENELMRHKVLDVVGDLYLAGYPIIGQYKGFKTGHYITNNLLKELFKFEDNFLIHQIH
jgi:UDP-3-O-[3-hydroxymyristoyl] N-acetylglucosamine deacetylase